MKLILASWSLLALLPAQAAEFSVTDQDQQNIQSVCDLASRLPDLNRDQRLGIVTYCVQWAARMQEANKPKPPLLPPDITGKN